VTRDENGVTLRQESPNGGVVSLDINEQEAKNWFADWDSTDRLWLHHKNKVSIVCTDKARLSLPHPVEQTGLIVRPALFN
jgi:hypothetical protein